MARGVCDRALRDKTNFGVAGRKLILMKYNYNCFSTIFLFKIVFFGFERAYLFFTLLTQGLARVTYFM